MTSRRKRLVYRKDRNRAARKKAREKRAEAAKSSCFEDPPVAGAPTSNNSINAADLSSPVQATPPLIMKLQDHLKNIRNNLRRDKYQSVTPDSLRTAHSEAGEFKVAPSLEDFSPGKKEAVKQVLERGKGKVRGRAMSRLMQNTIWNGYQFCRLEGVVNRPVISLNLAVKRTAAILGLNEATISKYVDIAKQGKPLLTPGKTRNRQCIKRNVDGFDRVAIESLIYELHRKKAHFTVASLLEEIRKRDIGFTGGRETLRMLLLETGFKFVRIDGTRFLRQSPSVALLRLEFLRRFVSLYQDLVLKGTHDLVFLDETWVFRKGTGKGFAWQNSDVRSCPIKFGEYGERYVVIHAGNKDGFIPGAGKIFGTRKKPVPGDDYHGDLNGPLFIKYFRQKLLPSLQRQSVILLDNASYHRLQVDGTQNPTTNWSKDKLVGWLLTKGVAYTELITVGRNGLAKLKNKVELYKIAKTKKERPQYIIEQLVEGTGHVILWLPPYHCLYNAIELIWACLKGHFGKLVRQAVTFTEEATILYFDMEFEVGDGDSDEDPLDGVSAFSDDIQKVSPVKSPPKIVSDWLPMEDSVVDDKVTGTQKTTRKKRETRRSLFAAHTSPDDDVAVVVKKRRYTDPGCRNEAVTSDVAPKRIKRLSSSPLKRRNSGKVEVKGPDVRHSASPSVSREGANENNSSKATQMQCRSEIVDLTSDCGPAPAPLNSSTRFPLSSSDMDSLKPDEQLNDQVIDYYLRLACEENTVAKALAITVHFYFALETASTGNRDWSFVRGTLPRRVNFADYQRLLIPINVGGCHWALVSVDMQHRVMTYFCSLNQKNPEATRGIARQSPGTVDCGPFVCFYGRYILDGHYPLWGPDINQYRAQIERELVSYTLEPTP